MNWGTFYANGEECSEEQYWQTINKYKAIAPDFDLIATLAK